MKRKDARIPLETEQEIQFAYEKYLGRNPPKNKDAYDQKRIFWEKYNIVLKRWLRGE